MDTIRNRIGKLESEEAAQAIYTAATFEVTEVRPLVDFGQVSPYSTTRYDPGHDKQMWSILLVYG